MSATSPPAAGAGSQPEARDLAAFLQQIPYLTVAFNAAGAEQAEFDFRGVAGRAQHGELGLALALAFPRSAYSEHIDTAADELTAAHHLSLLLASNVCSLDLGLQYDDRRWLFWKLFELDEIKTPQAIYLALDDMLSVMRFLHRSFFARDHHAGARRLTVAYFA